MSTTLLNIELWYHTNARHVIKFVRMAESSFSYAISLYSLLCRFDAPLPFRTLEPVDPLLTSQTVLRANKNIQED